MKIFFIINKKLNKKYINKYQKKKKKIIDFNVFYLNTYNMPPLLDKQTIKIFIIY